MSYETLTEKLLKGKKEEKFFVTVIPVTELGEVLLGKRTEDGIWTTPGGGADPGEEPHEAARRELFEEAGLAVPAGALELVSISETPHGFKIYSYLWRMPKMLGEVATSKLDPDKEVKSWKLLRPEDFPASIQSEQNASRLKTIREALMRLYAVKSKEDSNILSLADKLNKGGPGSGKKGHTTHKHQLISEIKAKAPHLDDEHLSQMSREHLEQVHAHHHDKQWDSIKSPPYNSDVEKEHKPAKQSKDAKVANNMAESHRQMVATSNQAHGDKKTEPQKMRDARRGIKHEEDTRTEAQRMADTRRGGPGFKRDWGKSESEVLSLADKLSKGGPGSGVQGHVSARKPSPLHPSVKAPVGNPQTKLQSHLQALQHGKVMPGMNTQSGKPIVNDMDTARAHMYDVQDHVDAMNAHYELSQRTAAILEKLKTAGHEAPAEGKKIAQFHEKKMKEHMNARQHLEERKKHTDAAIKEKKAGIAASIKKSVTQMGGGIGDRDLDVGSFAQANGQGSPEWMERLYSGMDGFEYGADSREFMTNKGILHLAKVDDGLYTGYFVKNDEPGLLDSARIRIERITIPELVQLMIAKEWIENHKVREEVKSEAPVAVDPIAQAGNAYAAQMDHVAEQIEQQETEAELLALNEALRNPQDVPPNGPLAQKIKLLELVAKLLG